MLNYKVKNTRTRLKLEHRYSGVQAMQRRLEGGA